MATSEWRDWHLTPDGWVRGTFKHDGEDRQEIPTPPGCVATYVYSEEMTSPVSAAMSRSVVKRWGDENDPSVKALLEKFGPCPRGT